MFCAIIGYIHVIQIPSISHQYPITIIWDDMVRTHKHFFDFQGRPAWQPLDSPLWQARAVSRAMGIRNGNVLDIS